MSTTLAFGFSPDVSQWKFRDNSGYISFDEFKTVFSANVGPGAIPFDFDWYAVYTLVIRHCTL